MDKLSRKISILTFLLGKSQLAQHHVILRLGSMSQPTHVGSTLQPTSIGSTPQPTTSPTPWPNGFIAWLNHGWLYTKAYLMENPSFKMTHSISYPLYGLA